MRICSRLLSLFTLAAVLAACGFTLRGTTPLPFETLYLGVKKNTAFGSWFKRAIQAASPDTQLVSSPRAAQAIYVEVSSTRGLREVSLNAAGRVEQYELTVTYTFRMVDQQGHVFLPNTSLFASREVPYDDQFLQAKNDEFQRIYDDLEQSLVPQVLRRLTAHDVRAAAQTIAAQSDATDEDQLLVPDLAPLPTDQPDAWQRDQPQPDSMFDR